MLRNAPDLFRRRGTREGLLRSIRLAFDLPEGRDPVLVEHGLARGFGAVASAGDGARHAARLGQTRLFSKARSRMTLGTSAIGAAPVMSYGDPAADAHAHGAFRFTVGLPPGARGDAASLLRLVEGQKPASTLARLRLGGGDGFLLGAALRLGVDTLLTRPAPAALGAAALRLSRGAVLAGRPATGPVLGVATVAAPTRSAPEPCTE
jgi:hypothetical protein